MNVAVQHTPAEAAYMSAGALLPPDKVRRDAFDRLMAMGLPHRRLEDWRWTDLRQRIAGAYPPLFARRVPELSRAGLERSPFFAHIRARIVVIDGFYSAKLSSLPATGGIEVHDLTDMEADWLSRASGATTASENDPILAMNTAFLAGGIAVKIAAGANVEAPFEILSIVTSGEPRTLASRILLVVEEGASASVVETHLGSESTSYVNNIVTEVLLAPGARLDRVKLQSDGVQAIHLSNLQARLSKGAILRDCTVTTGAATTRQQGFIAFEGENADAKITGTYLLRGRQHCDTRLIVDHRAPACTSREIFKCVVDEEARGIFQGKVIVERGAQKTDGKQSSHGLLLSPTAEFDAKPELEIYADDVACGHGATAGDLEEDFVFYLRSRGIPLAQARALLVSAFAAEAFEDIPHEPIRETLIELCQSWVHRGAQADG
jgi:Fe-S cluster assembly protein SufD